MMQSGAEQDRATEERLRVAAGSAGIPVSRHDVFALAEKPEHVVPVQAGTRENRGFWIPA
jgi:hypothetical protein